jgi:hypothetical protein
MGRADLFLEIPCVKQMRLDPMPSASMIEAVVGDYLLPPERGIYFKGSAEPAMVAGRVYHQHKVIGGCVTKEMNVVSTIEAIDRRLPVMDLDGIIVLTPTQIPFLSYVPVLPVTAMKIVEQAVKDVVETHGFEDYRRNPKHPVDLYSSFIHQPTTEDDKKLRDSIIDQIMELVSSIRSDVKSFCGENPWVIHFLRRRHLEFIVEKSIDWRILEYHRLTNTKLDYHE